ncbi:glycosyltransferase family 1 protein [Agrobacterium sp. DSM 25558]|uniref:glycosyltransferase family 4 protein n=1 Tax=Agrobacterium sp. DSM 25558 TaxID=1907665 RepID=UPI001FCD4586|nr:glycosyltransferase family 1 protein [Agrobacterium sp. DSM 25558]
MTENAAAKPQLKLAVILEKKISVGGGFNQSINAAMQMLQIGQDSFAVEIYTTIESNIPTLAAYGLEVKLFVKQKRKLLKKIAQSLKSARKRSEEVTEFEAEIRRQGIDLVYFTAPSGYALDLQTTPYIFTIWDLCHLEHPEFPEVTEKREFEKREALYSRAIVKAVVTLTDGHHTTELASRRYGVESNRFIEMPFSPAPFLQNDKSGSDEVAQILERYRLSAGYLFYPAQFWAHKNHIRLLEACALLAERDGVAPTVVLAGGDQGYAGEVKRIAERLGVSHTTHFLGFVPTEDMSLLYQGAKALVMPSYFGPSNLPPMEAWALGKPVLYPQQFADFVGDAALLFDPDDVQSLVNCIERLKCEVNEDPWKQLGQARLEYFSSERNLAEKSLKLLLARLASRLPRRA